MFEVKIKKEKGKSFLKAVSHELWALSFLKNSFKNCHSERSEESTMERRQQFAPNNSFKNLHNSPPRRGAAGGEGSTLEGQAALWQHQTPNPPRRSATPPRRGIAVCENSSKNIFKAAILLLLLKTLTADAQTLELLLKEARQNNPQLQSYAFKIQAAQNRADAAAAWPAPEIGVEFEQVPFNSVNIFNDAVSNNLTISQMFMLGGKLDAMRDAEAIKGKIEVENRSVAALKIEREIRMAYYSLWAIDRQIDLQKRNESVLKILLEASQAQYETGRAMQADLLMLQAEIASTRAQIDILKNRREPQLTMLASFLGRSGAVEITTTEEILNQGNMPNDEVLKAIAANPEIRRMQRMIDMSRAEINAAEREKIPDLMLGAMVMRMPNGMIQTMFPREEPDPHATAGERKSDYMYSLMASVTLPFAPWSRDKYLLKTQKQEANIKATELEITDMERMLAARISAAAERFKTAQRLQELFKNSVVPLYRQALEAQISAYQSGRATITSVLEIVRMLQMKEMDFIMAQEEAAMAHAEILSITGN